MSLPEQDAAVFEQLAMPLFDALYNFARWLTQDTDEAEDLVQETYAKALNGFASFQRGTNFKAWIFRILKNTFMTSRTGLRVTMTVALDDEEESTVAAPGITPEQALVQGDAAQLLDEALLELPVMYREVILLCDVEEMKYREIAEALSIPIGTVMSRLARARRAIRASLASRGLRTWSGASR